MAMYDPTEAYYVPPQQQMGPRGGPHGLIFDGKRMRKAIQRKTVDYTCPTVEYSEVPFFPQVIGIGPLPPVAIFLLHCRNKRENLITSLFCKFFKLTQILIIC